MKLDETSSFLLLIAMASNLIASLLQGASKSQATRRSDLQPYCAFWCQLFDTVKSCAQEIIRPSGFNLQTAQFDPTALKRPKAV